MGSSRAASFWRWDLAAGRSSTESTGTELPGRIDVSVRRRCELRRPGIRLRSRPSLSAQEIVQRDDIPVTSPVRTLVDLATELEAIPLERAVNDADKRGLVDPETLREELVRLRGEPGIRPLRHLLGNSNTASDFEHTPLCRKSVAT
jgi:hypothetical protein